MQKIFFFLFISASCFSQDVKSIKFSVFQTLYGENGEKIIENRLIEDCKYENQLKIASIQYVYVENEVIDTVIYMYNSKGKLKSRIAKTGKSNLSSQHLFYNEKGHLEKINWEGNILFYKNKMDESGKLLAVVFIQPETAKETTEKYKYYKNGQIKEKYSSDNGVITHSTKYNEAGFLIQLEDIIGVQTIESKVVRNQQNQLAYGTKRNTKQIRSVKSNQYTEKKTIFDYKNALLDTEISYINDNVFEKKQYFYNEEGFLKKIEHRNAANIIFEEKEYRMQ
jgi:hypothetical protein